MLHSIKDSKGNVICLCGDEFYENVINITKEKVNKFFIKNNNKYV